MSLQSSFAYQKNFNPHFLKLTPFYLYLLGGNNKREVVMEILQEYLEIHTHTHS